MRPATEVQIRASLPGEWRTTARVIRGQDETAVARAYEKFAGALPDEDGWWPEVTVG
ncbi:MAG: hypothetical protein O2992_08185 [Gemmatimonadetes bacterium]|nr:hypothetical protein [Gemmatimonadota bacterium]